MSILLPTDGQELAFNLPLATYSLIVSGQTVSIPVSGAVTRVSSVKPSGAGTEKSPNPFELRLTADLSSVQQNMTAILRSQIRVPRCGVRMEIQQATLAALDSASLVVADVHYERWVCPAGQGEQSGTEVASGDARVEIKLTTSIDPKAGLVLTSEIHGVESESFLRNLLRSGNLGVTLGEQVAAALLTALAQTADLKRALPPPAQTSATLQKAQFQDAGVERLSLVLEGELQLSDEQLAQCAAQLKHRQSAQATPQ